MKKFIRCVCLLIIVGIFFAVPSYAVQNVEQRSSDYFMRYCVYLWEPTDEVWFEVTALDQMDELGASKIKVQCSTDQVNWTTVQTYEKADYSQMIDKNTVTHAECVPFTFTSGYYYRGVVTLYAKKGTGTGTLTVVTPTLDLR